MLIEDFIRILESEQEDYKRGKALYRHISQAIRNGVLSGRIQPGTKLPASRFLAEALSVSRSTVVNSYELLIAEGLAEPRQGDGTYISQHISIKPSQELTDSNATWGQLFSKRAQPLIECFDHLDSENHSLFFPGLTDLGKFPDRYWHTISNRYAHTYLGTSLQKEHFGGYKPLREAIASHLNIARDVPCTADQVIIMNGFLSSTRFLFNLLCDAGDQVMIEEPGHTSVKSAALITELNIQPLEVDEEGARIPDSIPKIIYLTPSHQMPLGCKMSISRRLDMIRFAADNNVWIIEDDYDNEFPLSSTPLASLRGLDNQQCVIYSGTFSKVLASYIRVSYLVVPPRLAAQMRRAYIHYAFDVPFYIQATIADYMKEGHFHRHLRRVRSLYSQKHKLMAAAIDKEFSGLGKRLGGESGLHTVIELDSSVDDIAICRMASKQGMGIRALSEFCMNTPRRGLVLGFGYGHPRELEQGVRRLAKIVKAYYKKSFIAFCHQNSG